MPQQTDQLSDSPIATINTNHGDIIIKFYTEAAPELSKNFIELAKSGYYDNLNFHRIVPGFVIQGGDPNGDGTGGESYKKEGLADEPGALALKHTKGVVACAKSSLPNSIGSQFYIAVQDVPMLDGDYSVFGQVVEGMEAVDKITQVETNEQDKPKELVKILKVTVN